MTIDRFFILLERELANMQYSYDRPCEGKVYLGHPIINRNCYSDDDYKSWSYYLCFFVAFDLLVYTYFNENYQEIKDKLNIPKFEYGLTNTFYYPEDLFKRLNISINQNLFSKTFNHFIQFLEREKLTIDFKTVLKTALSDKDFEKGVFSKFLKEEILKL